MLDRHMAAFPRYKRGEFAEGPSYHKYYDNCFVVSVDDLQTLLKEMQHGVQLAHPDQPLVVDIRAFTRSGEMRFNNLNEIIGYSNEYKDRLQSVGISVRPENKSMMSLVRFQDYSPGWSVSVIVEGGDEQASLGLFDKMRHTIKPMFQWYSFLLDTRFWMGIMLTVIVGYAVFFVGPALAQKLNILPPPAPTVERGAPEGAAPDVLGPVTGPQQEGLRTLLIELAIIGIIALLFTFVVLPYLFPRGTFLIGEEIERTALIQKLRWGLLAALIVLPILAIVLTRSS